MSATITARINEGRETETLHEKICVREYLVQGEMDASQKPVVGDAFTSQSNWPGSEYLVKTADVVGQVRTGGITLDVLRVVGTTNLSRSAGGSGNVTTVDKLERIDKRMGDMPFVARPDLIGARKATWEDAGYHNTPGGGGMRIYMGEMDSVSVTLRIPDGSGGWTSKTMTLSGDNFRTLTYKDASTTKRASLGDYVYNDSYQAPYVGTGENGLPTWLARYDSSTGGTIESAGSADASLCPFVTSADHSVPSYGVQDVGKTLSIVTYTVRYWLETNDDMTTNIPHYQNGGRVSDWGPDGGVKYGPITHSGSPATTGVWRITNQEVESDTNYDGTKLVMITRSFERTPYAFTDAIWNPDIYNAWTADWPAT